MLSFGIVKGNNALSSTSQLHLLSTPTNLQENHTKFPKFIVSEFVEEIDNDENTDETHSDFHFISLSLRAFTFVSNKETLTVFPKSSHSSTVQNQKINVLNCIFLI
jgi:hypothetical protein